MRQQLIEALAYPKSMVFEVIEARRCRHRTGFDASSGQCLKCSINGQCHWATWLDRCDEIEKQPLHTLIASLRYGVKLVRSAQGRRASDVSTCQCRRCTWVRAAELLIEDFESGMRRRPSPYVH